MLSISSSNLMGMWIGLELNLLCVIPLFLIKKDMLSTESTMKYFIVQAITSSCILFFPFWSEMFKFSEMQYFTSMNWSENIMQTFMIIAIMAKIGSSPLHFWFPSVMEGLSWMNCFLLMTMQKIIPLMMLFLLNKTTLIILFAFFSAITGAIGGLTQFSIRSLLAFSSINHLSWLIMTTMLSMKMFLLYFLFYLMISLTICLMLSNMNVNVMKDMFSMDKMKSPMILIIMMNFISIAGIPPFLGFFPKMFMILELMQKNMFFITFIMIMMSLVTMYYYTLMTYSIFMISKVSYKNEMTKFMKLTNMKLSMTMMLSTLMNILMSLFFLMKMIL
uniref:NADH-ubiquinone oxidoreductase chain 2 n=1 Tax=Holarthrothrips indicus TaxID=1965675 RepID=A0A8A5LAB5_9NEOP|nr:NADH dehydrogenase subunit 2 [Holarthrothrips indicus]